MPPCINISEVKFSVSEDKIIFGLGAIKMLALNSCPKLLKIEKGMESSLIFRFRTKSSFEKSWQKALEMLISSGAFAVLILKILLC